MKTANSSMLCNTPFTKSVRFHLQKNQTILHPSDDYCRIIITSKAISSSFEKETIEIQFGNMSGFRIQFGET